MDDDKKNRGLKDKIKDGLEYTAQKISANISPPITEGGERVMQNLKGRITRIQERVIRKIFSFVIMGFGAIFLAFALFFYLRDYLGWSNSAAFFSIGTLMLVIGFLLNVGKPETSPVGGKT